MWVWALWCCTHGLTALAAFWSVEFCSRSLYSTVSRAHAATATHIKIVPVPGLRLRKAIAESCLSVKRDKKTEPDKEHKEQLREDVSQVEDFF